MDSNMVELDGSGLRQGTGDSAGFARRRYAKNDEREAEVHKPDKYYSEGRSRRLEILTISNLHFSMLIVLVEAQHGLFSGEI